MAFYIPTPSHSRAIDSHSFPFPILSPIPIPMGIPFPCLSLLRSLAFGFVLGILFLFEMPGITVGTRAGSELTSYWCWCHWSVSLIHECSILFHSAFQTGEWVVHGCEPGTSYWCYWRSIWWGSVAWHLFFSQISNSEGSLTTHPIS